MPLYEKVLSGKEKIALFGILLVLTSVWSNVWTKKVQNGEKAGKNTIQNIHYAPFVAHKPILTYQITLTIPV